MKVEIENFATIKNDLVILKPYSIMKFTFKREDHPELFNEGDKKNDNIKKMREDWKRAQNLI